MSRITRKNAKPPLGWPSNGQCSYLFQVKLWDSKKDCFMYYGGKRTLQSLNEEIGSYNGTSDDPEYAELYARSENVEIEYLRFDTLGNISTAEIELLTSVDAKNNANWFNKSNGGGLGAQGWVGMEMAFEVSKMVKAYNHKTQQWLGDIRHLPMGFYDIEMLKKMIDPNNLLQSRTILFDSGQLKYIKEAMKLDPNPDLWPPLVLLMPKGKVDWDKGTGSIPKIISGNHKSRGNIECGKGIGLNALEIPYSVWSKLHFAEQKALGNYLNPRDKTPALQQDFDTAVSTIIDVCEASELYRKNNDGKNIHDVKHDICKRYLKRSGFKPYQVTSVLTKAQTKVEGILARTHGGNIIDWKDDSIEIDTMKPYADYLKELKTYWEGQGWICYKISVANFSLEKMMEQFEKVENKGKTKLKLFPFFINEEHKQEWEESEPRKTGEITNMKRWLERKKQFFSKYTIDEIYLPINTCDFNSPKFTVPVASTPTPIPSLV